MVNEGAVQTVTVTFTDASSLDTFTAAVAWGDGSTGSVALAAGTTSFTATHLYADDNPSGTSADPASIGVTVTDDDTGSAAGTATITVANVAPAAGVAATAGVTEGGAATVTVTLSDAGALDPHTVTVGWGDGSSGTFALAAGATSLTAAHVYADDDPTGTPSDVAAVTVRVTDDDTGTASATAAVTVSNVAPGGVGVTPSAGTVAEGSPVTVTVTFTDASSLDTFTATVAWGDGATGSVALAAGATSFTASHVYADDSPTGTSADLASISVTVADDDTGTAAGSAAVTVANAAPAVTGLSVGPNPVAEGSPVTVTVLFTDAGSLDTFTAAVAWGDGSTGSVALSAGATSFTAAHVYADDSPTGTIADLASISVTVADDDLGSASQTVGVVVANVAPGGVGVAASAATVVEGGTVTVTVTFTDASSLDTFTAAVAWGDGATGSAALSAGATSFTASHVYADDNPSGTSADAALISVTVTDDDTGSAAGAATVTVANSAPVVTATLNTNSASEGDTVTLTGSFTDAGTQDTYTAVVSWGDGSPTQSVAVGAGASPRTFTLTHLYADDSPTGTPSDLNAVTVTVTDDDTGSGSASAAVTVSNVAPGGVGVAAGGVFAEGSPQTITVTFTDASSLDTFTAAVAWGDGSTGSVALAAGATSFTASHVYADDSPTGTSADLASISVTVADDDTGTAAGSAAVTVANVAPVVTGLSAGPNPVAEGSPVTVTVLFTDAGSLDTFTAAVGWGDGSSGTVALAAGATSFTAAHVYADDSPTGTSADLASISVTVADDDLGSASQTVGVVVANVARAGSA
ncbi:MAG: hypothetical protein U0804_12445 [Gemmataceae bacterium]